MLIMYLSPLLATFVAIAMVAQANADEQTFTLAYKFEMGDVLRYEVNHQADIRSTIEGTTQSAVTKSESVKLWKIQDVMSDGEIELLHMVESVRMTNKLPDRAEMVYDSTDGKTPPPGFEDAAKAVGVPLSVIRMTPSGKVVARDIKHKQPAADTEAPIATLLPEGPVKIGDTWNEPRKVTVALKEGGQRTIDARRHYKLTAVESGIATIDVAYQVLQPVPPDIEAQLVQRLMKGTILFDIDRGRVVSQRMKVDENVIGFAGPSSSMKYAMVMREQLVQKPTEVAARPE
jgi:hypothetical protein